MFFFLNLFSRTTLRLSQCHTFFWKAYASAVNSGYLETILVHATRRQNFADKLDMVLRNI